MLGTHGAFSRKRPMMQSLTAPAGSANVTARHRTISVRSMTEV